MLTVKNMKIAGLDVAIRGMRNPMNSWDKSDSAWCFMYDPLFKKCNQCCAHEGNGCMAQEDSVLVVGDADMKLMKNLFKAGTDHSKFMRMVSVWCDITAPLYWWKEYDTYKVGTVANSCSTMHKIHSKPIELSDFSIDDFEIPDDTIGLALKDCFINVVADCEMLRKAYLEALEKGQNDLAKQCWKGLIQLLPEGYQQTRTVMMNYQVAAKIIRERANHKLSEWHTLVNELKNLPYMREIMSDF